ncbi:Uncharacterized protein conserved in bacteria (DUF2187) [Mycobacteroides abscessus subsp. abscessus]|nr:Uncharacterized protein conserved in bacteria (DUF2187) [Mycobacteroides abscessus subsp. abscessus]
MQNVYNIVIWKEKERATLKRAEVGNVIEFRDGLQGIVEKVNENSVIVDLTYMDNYRDLELDQRTVVNHKNYKVIKESSF